MDPRAFLKRELMPVIDGLGKRNLLDLVEENKLDEKKLHLRISLLEGGYTYLIGYLNSYIFPKLMATEVTFERFAYGDVTNKKGVKHIELIINM